MQLLPGVAIILGIFLAGFALAWRVRGGEVKLLRDVIDWLSGMPLPAAGGERSPKPDS